MNDEPGLAYTEIASTPKNPDMSSVPTILTVSRFNAALVRAFGPELAEVPLLATRYELQGNALAPLLLHHIEHTLLQAGVTRIIMPALPMPEAPSPEAPLPDQAALPVTASNPKPWGSLVGYTMPSPAQLLQACRTSMLQLPGTPYLIKQLSADSIVKVRGAPVPGVSVQGCMPCHMMVECHDKTIAYHTECESSLDMVT